jgi:predicted phosphodiesterase
MKIRWMSDIHLEFGWMEIISQDEDKDTVLILAGDIGLVHDVHRFGELGRFLAGASKQFRAVIYVLGNHEHYKHSYVLTHQRIRDTINDRNLDNVFVLERETKIIDDVAFVGATLWTNYDNNPVNQTLAMRAMYDHKLISTGMQDDPYAMAFSPQHARDDFELSKAYVFEQTKQQKAAGNKVVVIVHHGVSEQSVHARFKGDPYNSCFVSELFEDILDAKPDVVVHGHVHNAFDYMIGDTRILVNPRGYPGYEWDQNGFDPVARFEL